jgi:hypothetical protein
VFDDEEGRTYVLPGVHNHIPDSSLATLYPRRRGRPELWDAPDEFNEPLSCPVTPSDFGGQMRNGQRQALLRGLAEVGR